MDPDKIEKLLKKYRALHRNCEVLTWNAAKKGFSDITVDARCPLCKAVDNEYGEPTDTAELKK